jgi:hypothetical protein
MVGKLFEKILLTRVFREANEGGLLRDEQFGFRSRHSMALQLARLVERVNRNFDERRLTGAVFLHVTKAFGTVWVEGLLYKLTILNFPSYLVKTFIFITARSKRPSNQPLPHVVPCGLEWPRADSSPPCCSVCM